jgi:UDPglucose 6-dehydrogenase
VNERQKRLLLRKVCRAFDDKMKGRTVAVWGLAFKAETDDMRESPSIPLVEGLLSRGAEVRVHDPKAVETAQALFGDRVFYAPDPYAAVQGADALAIVTEWLVYRNPDFERLRVAMVRPLIVDGRNLYDPQRLKSLGFEYHGIGRRGS